jgi:hypothetical protein
VRQYIRLASHGKHSARSTAASASESAVRIVLLQQNQSDNRERQYKMDGQ